MFAVLPVIDELPPTSLPSPPFWLAMLSRIERLVVVRMPSSLLNGTVFPLIVAPSVVRMHTPLPFTVLPVTVDDPPALTPDVTLPTALHPVPALAPPATIPFAPLAVDELPV